MDKPTMPLLPPEPPPKPRNAWLIYLGALFGFILVAGLTFVIMGSLWPVLLGLGVLVIIGLQYLLWGWWFERIYRSGDGDRNNESLS